MTVQRWFRIVRLRIRTLIRRGEVERELDEELAYHVLRQTEENEAKGMSPTAARTAALRALGGVELRKEQVRDTRGTGWIEGTWREATLAVRSLRRNPAFTATVVLTLGLGIGANTAMFTMLRGTLLRSLPNRDGDRLLYLHQSAPGAGQAKVLFSVPEVADYRARSQALAAIAEYSNVLPVTLVGADGHPERVHAAVVSGNYFDVVGLAAVAGRVMSAGDDGAAADPVMVLSYGYWIQHFGGDPGIIGRTVDLNEKVTTVIGVLEPAPEYPQPTDVFVNTVTSPHHLSATMVTERTHRMTEIFARLSPQSTVEQGRTEIARIADGMYRDHPEAYERTAQFSVAVSPLRDAENSRASLTFWLLMGGAVFVLLISWANVSNLTLMRSVERGREMLVRAALGAGRGHLRRGVLLENLVLALLGGALGVLVALTSLRLLVRFAAQFSPRASEIGVDGLVLGVALATSVVAAVALSFLPAIRGERGLALSLVPAARGTTLGRGRRRLQRGLVVAQIAASMVLLTGAGLLLRTLAKLQAVETGVQIDHVLTVDLPFGGDLLRQVMNQPANLANYQRIRDRVATLHGVATASVGSVAPLRNSIMDFDVKAENRVADPESPTPHATLKTVDPRYLEAAGIPLLAGRRFADTDRVGTTRVAILSESLARQLFDAEDPIGRQVALTGEVLKFTPFADDWRTVVGIAADTRDRGLEGDPTPALYVPFAQDAIVGGTLLIRTTLDPDVLRSSVVQAIRDVAPSQLIERVATLEEIRDTAVGPRRLNAMFIVAFGVLALIIAMVGIAGVLAFSVGSRTAEIGVRMSFGADAGRVQRMILREGGTLIAAGVGVGFAGALAAARLLRGLLFGVGPGDPITLAAVATLLVTVGLAACWLPAARAAGIDPCSALREE